jgi:hypothetical protein
MASSNDRDGRLGEGSPGTPPRMLEVGLQDIRYRRSGPPYRSCAGCVKGYVDRGSFRMRPRPSA